MSESPEQSVTLGELAEVLAKKYPLAAAEVAQHLAAIRASASVYGYSFKSAVLLAAVELSEEPLPE